MIIIHLTSQKKVIFQITEMLPLIKSQYNCKKHHVSDFFFPPTFSSEARKNNSLLLFLCILLQITYLGIKKKNTENLSLVFVLVLFFIKQTSTSQKNRKKKQTLKYGCNNDIKEANIVTDEYHYIYTNKDIVC